MGTLRLGRDRRDLPTAHPLERSRAVNVLELVLELRKSISNLFTSYPFALEV